jgi:hypothetical protein
MLRSITVTAAAASLGQEARFGKPAQFARERKAHRHSAQRHCDIM